MFLRCAPMISGPKWGAEDCPRSQYSLFGWAEDLMLGVKCLFEPSISLDIPTPSTPRKHLIFVRTCIPVISGVESGVLGPRD